MVVIMLLLLVIVVFLLINFSRNWAIVSFEKQVKCTKGNASFVSTGAYYCSYIRIIIMIILL